MSNEQFQTLKNKQGVEKIITNSHATKAAVLVASSAILILGLYSWFQVSFRCYINLSRSGCNFIPTTDLDYKSDILQSFLNFSPIILIGVIYLLQSMVLGRKFAINFLISSIIIAALLLAMSGSMLGDFFNF